MFGSQVTALQMPGVRCEKNLQRRENTEKYIYNNMNYLHTKLFTFDMVPWITPECGKYKSTPLDTGVACRGSRCNRNLFYGEFYFCCRAHSEHQPRRSWQGGCCLADVALRFSAWTCDGGLWCWVDTRCKLWELLDQWLLEVTERQLFRFIWSTEAKQNMSVDLCHLKSPSKDLLPPLSCFTVLCGVVWDHLITSVAPIHALVVVVYHDGFTKVSSSFCDLDWPNVRIL